MTRRVFEQGHEACGLWGATLEHARATNGLVDTKMGSLVKSMELCKPSSEDGVMNTIYLRKPRKAAIFVQNIAFAYNVSSNFSLA